MDHKQTTWTIIERRLFSPRSEHWITRRWHWHLKGHLGPSGMVRTEKSVITSVRPDPASSSIMKSRKPDWRKGRAQQAVTRSRERQADLMVLLAGSLRTRGHRSKVLGGFTLKIVCLWLVFKLPCVTICFWFNVIIEMESKGRQRDAVWERQNKRHWLASGEAQGKGERWRVRGQRAKHLGVTI